MKISAIITAGGLGVRMKSSTPKQFIKIADQSIVERTIDIFKNNKNISEIIVVLPKDHLNAIQDQEIIKVAGGKTRQESVYNGLMKTEIKPGLAIIHDGVRCLLTQIDLDHAIQACQKPYDGVVLAHPVRDTLKRVNKETIEQTIDRENLWAMQTPQVFSYNAIVQAYKKVIEDGAQVTDDAQAIEYIGGKVKVIQGSNMNIKITLPEDVEFLKKWMVRQ